MSSDPKFPDEPIQINDFADICGHFNNDVDINNGYGCDHPRQSEWAYARVKDGHSHDINEGKVQYVLLRKRFGSYAEILKADQQGKAKEYLQTAEHDPQKLSEINVIKQGKCFAHSCPLACNLESEDWVERGEASNMYSHDWVLPHQPPQTTPTP